MRMLRFVAFCSPLPVFLMVWPLFYSGLVSARSLEDVGLTEISSSERSIIIDRGLLESYKSGMVAKFFVQAGDFKFPKVFLVAEGKLIKSFPKQSYWYLNKIYLPQKLHPGEQLLILTSKDVSEGRAMKSKQRHVLVSPERYKSVNEYVSANSNNIPDRLVQKEANTYKAFDELYEIQKKPEASLQIETYETMKNKSGIRFSDEYNDETEEKFFIGSKEVQLGNLKNDEDKKLLDAMGGEFEEKINSQKVGLMKGLYKNQKKVTGARDMDDHISIMSVYDTVLEDKKYRDIIDPKVMAKTKRDGLLWSADMDDETLRRYFIRTGLAHEERRREIILNEMGSNELILHYGGSILGHTVEADQSYQGLGYTLGFGYDLHLRRISQNIKDWSLQFVLERGVSYYDIGGMNAMGTGIEYGIYLNYYLDDNSASFDQFIWLMGMGLKKGSVNMHTEVLSKDYSYQTLTIPSMQVMTKYRFRKGELTENDVNMGVSFNAGVMLDIKRLSVVESLNDHIEGQVYVKDLKYILGMSVYF